MSAWKDWRDAEPIERSGRDEWGACCWWQGTTRCHCDDPWPPVSKVATTTPATAEPRWIERWEIKQ